MHDCLCCGHATDSDDPLCSECREADCEPNSEGVYDCCNVPDDEDAALADTVPPTNPGIVH